MRHLRWQLVIAILGMLLVGSLLNGKAQSGGADGPAVVLTAEPVRGGVYTEALIGLPRQLNPLLDYNNPVDRDIDRLVFSGLTRFDAYGRPQPDLANWIVSDDGLTYTFVLRADARWHDGRPVTTADVAFTVGLLQNPKFSGPPELARLWQALSLAVINDQAFTVTLPEPFAPFLDYTTFGLLPEHLLGQTPPAQLAEADFNHAPIGAGPFRFVALTGENGQVNGARLAAFADYFGPAPLLNEVAFRFYPEVGAALAGYQAGEVLGISRIDAAHLNQALQTEPLGVYTALLPEYSLIYLNLQSDELPFFQDKKVRQALLRGLNRSAMVNQLLNGQAVVANSPVLPGSWAYNPTLPNIAYDPAAAAKLLDSAGWVIPDGAAPGSEGYVRRKGELELRFTLTTPNDDLHLALAQAAAATWKQLGVIVTVNAVAPNTVREAFLLPRPRVFDAVLVDLNLAGTPDPDPYPMWHETQVESGQNYGGFNDRVSSELLEQARITTDLGARARLYYQFQSRFIDQTPALLLFYPVYNYAVDKSVIGVQIGPLIEASDRLNTLAQWSLATRRVSVEQPAATPTR
ncbi:MAG: peptide ABC transporter substrate-binding protein [Anaerolineales bacterium]|nr:peptide ABC transporter substrate-binding protein [Anaerolineales bacterium]